MWILSEPFTSVCHISRQILNVATTVWCERQKYTNHQESRISCFLGLKHLSDLLRSTSSWALIAVRYKMYKYWLQAINMRETQCQCNISIFVNACLHKGQNCFPEHVWQEFRCRRSDILGHKDTEPYSSQQLWLAQALPSWCHDRSECRIATLQDSDQWTFRRKILHKRRFDGGEHSSRATPAACDAWELHQVWTHCT